MRHFTWLLSIWNHLFYFAGSWNLGVSHSVNAEDSPKCIRTLFVKSCGEDVGSGIFWCSTRDSDQSFWCLSTVFHCSVWILNDKIASLHQVSVPGHLRFEAPERMDLSRKTTRDTPQWCSYTTAWRMLGKLKCRQKWKVGKIFNFSTREQDYAKWRTFREDFFSKVEKNRFK